jgi:hypothetical protein
LPKSSFQMVGNLGSRRYFASRVALNFSICGLLKSFRTGRAIVAPRRFFSQCSRPRRTLLRCLERLQLHYLRAYLYAEIPHFKSRCRYPPLPYLTFHCRHEPWVKAALTLGVGCIVRFVDMPACYRGAPGRRLEPQSCAFAAKGG